MNDKNKFEKLFSENKGLVYYFVNKLGVRQNYSAEYDDIVSEGKVGLMKAVSSFDESKGYKFATYATRCIQNEIFMYLRRIKKHQNVILSSEFFVSDDEGKEIDIYEQLEDPNSYFIEDIEKKEIFDEVVNIMLNCLSVKEKLILLYQMAELTQNEIAKKLGLSQSYISRIANKVPRKLKKFLNGESYYKGIFFMSIGKEYRISFSPKNITKFNKVFSEFLENIASHEILPDFQISCNKERVAVRISAHPKAFAFIAKMIQEIDELNMTYVSVPELKVEKEKVDATNESGLTESKVSQQKSNCLNMGRANKQIRDYISNCDGFSHKQLRKHFPNVSVTIINNEIQRALKNGSITRASKGVYKVNKN